MEKIPCSICTPELWRYVKPYLKRWGYENVDNVKIDSFIKFPLLVINQFGWQNYCDSENLSSCKSYNRVLVADIEEFLQRAAALKGFTYKRKDIMEIKGIKIKPGMGIYLNNKKSDNLYIVIPTKKGLGVIAYGKSNWWEDLDKFLELYSNQIVTICDIPNSIIEGNILWEKPKEIIITMDEIAEKFGYPVEQIKIMK